MVQQKQQQQKQQGTTEQRRTTNQKDPNNNKKNINSNNDTTTTTTTTSTKKNSNQNSSSSSSSISFLYAIIILVVGPILSFRLGYIFKRNIIITTFLQQEQNPICYETFVDIQLDTNNNNDDHNYHLSDESYWMNTVLRPLIEEKIVPSSHDGGLVTSIRIVTSESVGDNDGIYCSIGLLYGTATVHGSIRTIPNTGIVLIDLMICSITRTVSEDLLLLLSSSDWIINHLKDIKLINKNNNNNVLVRHKYRSRIRRNIRSLSTGTIQFDNNNNNNNNNNPNYQYNEVLVHPGMILMVQERMKHHQNHPHHHHSGNTTTTTSTTTTTLSKNLPTTIRVAVISSSTTSSSSQIIIQEILKYNSVSSIVSFEEQQYRQPTTTTTTSSTEGNNNNNNQYNNNNNEKVINHIFTTKNSNDNNNNDTTINFRLWLQSQFVVATSTSSLSDSGGGGGLFDVIIITDPDLITMPPKEENILLPTLVNSLSSDGIIILAAGTLPKTGNHYVPAKFTTDIEAGTTTTRIEAFLQTLQKDNVDDDDDDDDADDDDVEESGIQHILEYSEAIPTIVSSDRYSRSKSLLVHRFIILMKDKSLVSNWVGTEAEIKYVLQKSTNGPFNYVDGSIYKVYEVPHRIVEDIWCRSTPSYNCYDKHGFDPNILEAPISSFRVQVSTIENGGRGIYTTQYVYNESYIALGQSVQGLLLYPNTYQILRTLAESIFPDNPYYKCIFWGYFDGYGWHDNIYGRPSCAVDSGIFLFANHGCGGTNNIGTKVDFSELTLQYDTEYDDVDFGEAANDDDEIYVWNIYQDRNAPYWHTNAVADIPVGDEVFDNYLLYGGKTRFNDNIRELKGLCEGLLQLGPVSEYEKEKEILEQQQQQQQQQQNEEQQQQQQGNNKDEL